MARGRGHGPSALPGPSRCFISRAERGHHSRLLAGLKCRQYRLLPPDTGAGDRGPDPVHRLRAQRPGTAECRCARSRAGPYRDVTRRDVAAAARAPGSLPGSPLEGGGSSWPAVFAPPAHRNRVGSHGLLPAPWLCGGSDSGAPSPETAVLAHALLGAGYHDAVSPSPVGGVRLLPQAALPWGGHRVAVGVRDQAPAGAQRCAESCGGCPHAASGASASVPAPC